MSKSTHASEGAGIQWRRWSDFVDRQQEIVLPAGSVNHLDVRVRYIDEGVGERGTVTLLHGIPTWGFLYHAVIPALCEAGLRVIVPDLLGHGFSDRRDRFDRSFQDQARMILALAGELGLRQTHLVGHDTGGAVGLILAIEHAHLIDHLVLANAVCYDRFDDDMLDFGHPMRWANRPTDDVVAALEESLAAGLSKPDRLTEAFRDAMVAPVADAAGVRSLSRNASALNANQTMALVDRHGSISAPTMVLWGADDPWQRVEDGRRLASEIPGATMVELDGVSHWLQQDDPERFTDAVLAFLP